MIIFKQAGIAWDVQQKRNAKAGLKAAKKNISIDNWDSLYLNDSTDPSHYINQALNFGLQQAAKRDALQEAARKKAIEENDFLSYLPGKDAADALRKADAQDGWRKAQKKTYVKNWVDEEAYAHIGMLISAAMIDSQDRQYRRRQQTSPSDTIQQKRPTSSTVQKNSQQNAYELLNQQLINAANSNNENATEQIFLQMQSQGVPLFPAAQSAVDAFGDRMINPYIQDLENTLLQLQ
ncbi:MAG: hypothetical protein KKI15_02925 [Proteobacteria bacterium]|nr:hypothetical protein [Pseudomonadota bacterium]